MEIPPKIVEVHVPGVEPQAVLPFPVVSRRAQLQPSQVAVEREWIDAEPPAVRLPVGVGGDVGEAVERLADDRLRQGGIIARPVGYPKRVIGILPKLAPLIRATQLHPDIRRRHQRLGSEGQRRGDEAVDPERPLVFEPVPEGLVEGTQDHLHVVVEEYLSGVDRRAERRARTAWTERGSKGAFERQPVVEAIEHDRAEVDREGILAGLPVIDEIGGRRTRERELSRAPVATERLGKLPL